jgi:hypothetical protein
MIFGTYNAYRDPALEIVKELIRSGVYASPSSSPSPAKEVVEDFQTILRGLIDSDEILKAQLK